MTDATILTVDGAVSRELHLSRAMLDVLPATDHVPDVSRFHAGRPGDGVSLESLLRLAEPSPEADHLTLHAGRDDFHVSVPLAAVRGEGIVVYKVGDGPLETSRGGPVRFMIRDPSACHARELDDCANVKYLDRIELTIGRGLDTRPADEAAHAALHAR